MAPEPEVAAAEDAASQAAPAADDAADAGGGGEAVDRVMAAMEKVLDEWLVTGVHRAAAQHFIKERIASEKGEVDCLRVRRWLLLRMNGRVWDHGQPLMCRTPENVPGLRTWNVWPKEEFPWLAEVESHFPAIKEELLAARGGGGSSSSGFQPYRDPIATGNEDRAAADGLGAEGVDRGMWNVLYLLLNHKKFEDNCARFPATLRAIEKVFPRSYSHAFFSALTPGSHIVKHHGPSNRMLRVWLPLIGLEGFRLRVGDQILQPREGEAFVWDHSFEHEAWHEGDETRVVLIVDVWHPDLTNPEVKFLSTLQSCRLRAGRALVEHYEQQQKEEGQKQDSTYFDIVEKAKHLLTDDDWWVVNAERDPTTRPT